MRSRTWITFSLLSLVACSVVLSLWSLWAWGSTWGSVFTGVQLTSPLGCDCGMSVTFWQHPVLYSLGLVMTAALTGLTSWVAFLLLKSWKNTQRVVNAFIRTELSSAVNEVFDTLSQQIFPRYWPRIFYPKLVSIQEPTPRAMSTGFFRPTIFVSSATLEQVPQEELSAILVHELMHIKSFDPVLLWVSSALSSLVPTHWKLKLQTALQEYVECKTDSEAAEVVGQPVLGRALLRVAAWQHLPQLQASAQMRGHVETRLQVLAGFLPRPEIPWRSILGLSFSFCALVTSAVVALRQVDQVYAQELHSLACMEAESIVYIDNTLVLICPAPLMSVE